MQIHERYQKSQAQIALRLAENKQGRDPDAPIYTDSGTTPGGSPPAQPPLATIRSNSPFGNWIQAARRLPAASAGRHPPQKMGV